MGNEKYTKRQEHTRLIHIPEHPRQALRQSRVHPRQRRQHGRRENVFPRIPARSLREEAGTLHMAGNGRNKLLHHRACHWNIIGITKANTALPTTHSIQNYSKPPTEVQDKDTAEI